MRKILVRGGIAVVAILVLIQLVPYGRAHSNPPIVQEPQWDSPETRALAVRACYDCHSNETDWSRWYESVAPASWLVQRDVDEGRQHLNFSDWANTRQEVKDNDLTRAISGGDMPPIQFTLMHPEARLTDAEKQQLIAGLEKLGR